MAILQLDNIDDYLVQCLCERAAANGRSIEAEHRSILIEALRNRKRPSFAEYLCTMPEVGLDSDFVRVDDVAPGEFTTAQA